MPATFIAGSFVTSTQVGIYRPAGVAIGDLAVVATSQTTAATGWTRHAAAGGTGGVYTRVYDGTSNDTFPMLDNPQGLSHVPRVLAVWRDAIGVEDVSQASLTHSYAASPGGSTTLPSRTTARRAATYVWQAWDPMGVSAAAFSQNPVAPLTARLTSQNTAQMTADLYRAYVASALLDQAGASGTFTQRFVSSTTSGSTGTDFTYILKPTNVAPLAPTLLTPAVGEVVSKDETNRLSWQVSDPNVGDAQSKANVRYRVQGATSWVTVAVPGPNPYVDIAAGTFAEAAYEWQVQTFDAEGLEGPWSGSSFFTAGTRPPGPAITSLVNGQTVNDTPVLVEWTATAGATHFQVRRVADAAGVADTANVLFTSDELLASAGQAYALALPTNSQYEHVQVREKVAGLYSAWAASSKRILVSYTIPATALLSVVPDEDAYALAVQVLNPTPTNGQPSRAYNQILVTALTPGDQYRPMGVEKVAAAQFVGSLFLDDRVASGVSYAYRVRTVASNGTASMSALVDGYRDLGVTPGTGGNFYDAATFGTAVLG